MIKFEIVCPISYPISYLMKICFQESMLRFYTHIKLSTTLMDIDLCTWKNPIWKKCSACRNVWYLNIYTLLKNVSKCLWFLQMYTFLKFTSFSMSSSIFPIRYRKIGDSLSVESAPTSKRTYTYCLFNS